MSEILSAVVPVFIVASLAFVIRRRMPLDTKTLSSLNIYLFIPALVFAGLSHREIHWAFFARIAAASVLMLLAMTLVLSFVAKRRRIANAEYSAFLMTQFPNLGNFGLPVCLFAFGEEGLAIALVVMVCGSFLQNSVGIYFAQRTHHSVGKAFLRVFRFPMIYAFLLALAFQRFDLHFPAAVSRAIDILSDAAIPVQLMILGVQLAQTRLDMSTNLSIACAIRLLGGPLLAAAMVIMLGFDDLSAKVFITQLSGPVAIGMTAYSVQFDVAPRFLASVVAWTFVASLATVSLVLFVLTHVHF